MRPRVTARRRRLAVLPLVLLSASLSTARARHPEREWRVYGGDPGATRYSPLAQIDRSNVHQLRVAWVFHTGDKHENPPSTIECNLITAPGDAGSAPNRAPGGSNPASPSPGSPAAVVRARWQ
jgi:hypothetical protein